MKRKIKTLFLLALLLVAATQTARAQAQATIGGITYNDEGGYYVIDEADDLSDLAVYVNGAGTYRNGQTEETTAHNCEGLKFKMIQDIAFESTTAWNEASSTENNYVPIGGSGATFNGDFDGDGHTISGIRILRTSNIDDCNYKGIFGRIGSGANIHGLRLADARITGYQYIGGIVGDNTDGTITDCHVANDVCIHAVQSSAMFHGGIAGYNLSYFDVATVESCTSAATLTIADEENATGCYDYGAIVGLNSGTLTGNFAIGATVPAATNNRYGAIAGRNVGNNATLLQNYYTACKVASENVTPTGVGCQNADVTANDGAVSIPAVTLGEGVSIISPEKPTITYGGTNYYRTGETLTLGTTADAIAGYESYGYFVDGSSYQLTPGADGTFTYIVDATHGNVTITLFGFGAIDWATVNKGTAEDPYMIYNRYQLDLLSRRVNGLDKNLQSDDFSFSGKFFRLGADIVYPHKNADEEDADIEPNYMSIGGYDVSQDHYFNGDFDGAGHTISGIRIYNDLTGDYDNYQGIFGLIGSGANIHGLRLADARITGYRYIGGIVGHNYCGTITDCHVANDVCIHAVQSGAMWHGGIAGYNQTYFDGDATIERCTSAATLTIADDATGCYNYGGIVGYNSGTLTGNLAIGVTVPAAGSENRHGAIAGNNSGILANNYYTACKVASANVTPTGVGCGGIGNAAVGYKADDVATDDGAVPALRDDASNAEAIALLAALASAADGHTPLDLGWGAGLFPLQLADRTLTKDGTWNTLCLPFSVTTLAGTPLEGATIKELDNSGSGTSLSDDGVLTLKFTEASSIAAGKPYIVKWEGASGTASPLTFADVTIAGTEPTEVVSSDGNVKFVGQYSPFGITDDNISSILYIASDNKIGYSASSRTLKALRAHFWVKPDGTAPAARRIDIDFGDGEATSIILVSADSESAVSGVYTLDGRKLSGQPTTKGVYIVNGKKIVVE